MRLCITHRLARSRVLITLSHHTITTSLLLSVSICVLTHALIHTCWINKRWLISQRLIAGHRLTSSSLGMERNLLGRSRTDPCAWGALPVSLIFIQFPFSCLALHVYFLKIKRGERVAICIAYICLWFIHWISYSVFVHCIPWYCYMGRFPPHPQKEPLSPMKKPFGAAASTCSHSVGAASNQINRITVNGLSVVIDTIFIGQRCDSVPIPRLQKSQGPRFARSSSPPNSNTFEL